METLRARDAMGTCLYQLHLGPAEIPSIKARRKRRKEKKRRLLTNAAAAAQYYMIILIET